MPRALPFVLVFGLLASCRPSEVPASREAAAPVSEAIPHVEAFVRDVIDRFDIPGMTIAIVRDGEVSYTGAFGVRSLASGEPLTPDHVFHMASVSKPFVATAVMQLVEQGKVDLGAPVTTYLPYFELDDERFREITVRQMLSHTSGMPDVRDYEWDNPQFDEGAAERYVRSLKDEKMIAAPGERCQYSNMAFDTLGDLIAKVSGMTFEAYMKENVLDPLGMVISTFYYPDVPEERRTSGHVWRLHIVPSDVYPYNRRHAPSSTLNSSVVEMTRWALANLNRGELAGRRILEAASYDVLWQPQAEVREGRYVGLSWFLSERHGKRVISHSGGDTGFNSYIALVPDEDLGVILAMNSSDTPLNSTLEGVLDVLLGYEPTLPKPPAGQEFAEVYQSEGLEAAEARYRKLQSESADAYDFDDGDLNRLGYYYLRREGAVGKAIEVFAFNTELFPEVANTWDSLGEAYMVAGRKDEAVTSYRKSLELDPGNDNGREMLAKLGAPETPRDD